MDIDFLHGDESSQQRLSRAVSDSLYRVLDVVVCTINFLGRHSACVHALYSHQIGCPKLISLPAFNNHIYVYCCEGEHDRRIHEVYIIYILEESHTHEFTQSVFSIKKFAIYIEIADKQHKVTLLNVCSPRRFWCVLILTRYLSDDK